MKFSRYSKGLALLVIFCLLAGLPGNASAFIISDKQPPQLKQAKAIGTLLTLEFNELLKSIPAPDPGLFSVKVNGTNQDQPKSAVVALNTLTICLAATVKPGDQIAISYQTGTNGIEDLAGNNAAEFIDYPVENYTLDVTPPLLEEAFVTGASLSLIYNEPLDEESVPNGQCYSILINGNKNIHPDDIRITDKDVILHLPYTVQPSDNIKISYAALINPIRDLSCIPALPLVLQPVVNKTLPENQGPVITTACADGRSITLTYSRNLKEEPLPDPASFIIAIAGQEPFSPIQVSISGNQIILSMDQPLQAEDTLTVSYIPGQNPVQDCEGRLADALTAYPVKNHTEGDITPPQLQEAVINGPSICLLYDEPLDATAIPDVADFTVYLEQMTQLPRRVQLNQKSVVLSLETAAQEATT